MLELANAIAGAPQFALEAPDVCIDLIAVVAAHLLREDRRVVRCWTGSGVSGGHLASLAGSIRCWSLRIHGWARGSVLVSSRQPPATQVAGGPCSAWSAVRRLRAHTGSMGRMIWTILGVILAIWVGFMAIGWILAMFKTFFVIGLIAVVVFIVVSLVAKLPRRS